MSTANTRSRKSKIDDESKLENEGVEKPKQRSTRKSVEHLKGEDDDVAPMDADDKAAELGSKRKDDDRDTTTEEPEPGPPQKQAKKKVGDVAKAETVEEEDAYATEDGILERGHIYFFYRPKVALGPEDTVTSIDQTSKFYFVLVPRGSKGHFRLFVIGKKRLPDPFKGARETFWGALEVLGADFKQLKSGDALGEQNYDTKTMGPRHNEPSRIAGRGHYALFSPKPDKPSDRATHLVYYTTHPASDSFGDVQRELSIYESGSFILQITNPTSRSRPPYVGLPYSKRAEYGEDLLEEKFGGFADTKDAAGKKFIAPNPAKMLDFEGTEILIIGEKSDPKHVLEAEGGTEKVMEKEAEKEAKGMTSFDVLKELKLDEATFPCDALEGDWL